MSGRAGLPIVCLPGIRGDRAIFDSFLEELDARGHRGLSLDLPPGPPALAARRLELPERAHLLTGSYGGLIARFLPPKQVASLACVATLPHPRHLQPAMAQRARWVCRLPDALLEPLYHRHGQSSLRADGVPQPVLDALDGRPLSPHTLRERLRAVFAGHHGAPLSVPTLWVHGDRDPQVVWTDEDVRAACPWATVTQVPGGHFPHASHPTELLNRLEPWWTRAERAPQE